MWGKTVERTGGTETKNRNQKEKSQQTDWLSDDARGQLEIGTGCGMLHRYRHVLLAHTQMNWVGRCWFSRKNSTIPKKGEIFQQCQWHQISIKVLSWTHLCSTSAKRTSTRTGAAETFKLFSNLAIASGSEKDGSFFFLERFRKFKKKSLYIQWNSTTYRAERQHVLG